jgi:hypothetical protein
VNSTTRFPQAVCEILISFPAHGPSALAPQRSKALAPIPEARNALTIAISQDGQAQVIDAQPGQPH